MVNKILKKQSAFSLIEVLVSLLLISIILSGTSTLLLESTFIYQRAIIRQKAMVIAWSIAESLRLEGKNIESLEIIDYWKNRLEMELSGSTLHIEEDSTEDNKACAIVIQFPDHNMEKLELKIVI